MMPSPGVIRVCSTSRLGYPYVPVDLEHLRQSDRRSRCSSTRAPSSRAVADDTRSAMRGKPYTRASRRASACVAVCRCAVRSGASRSAEHRRQRHARPRRWSGRGRLIAVNGERGRRAAAAGQPHAASRGCRPECAIAGAGASHRRRARSSCGVHRRSGQRCAANRARHRAQIVLPRPSKRATVDWRTSARPATAMWRRSATATSRERALTASTT